MQAFKNLKIQHKMLFPNVLNIMLLGAIIFFFVNSSTMIKDLTQKQKAADKATDEIQNTALSVRSYMSNHISFAELNKRCQTMLDGLRNGQMSADCGKLWEKVQAIRQIRTDNAGIEKEIDALTDNSIEQSNGYIKQMVQKLVDEKARSSVSTLERQVILGANINTSSNYRLRLLFDRLKGNISENKAILDATSALIANSEGDEKSTRRHPLRRIAEKVR